jgi:hypothetical protein
MFGEELGLWVCASFILLVQNIILQCAVLRVQCNYGYDKARRISSVDEQQIIFQVGITPWSEGGQYW